MSNAAFKYSLARNKKIDCPSCRHKKCFVPYIDNETKETLSYTVGKCDREMKCGYHMPPREYAEQNGLKFEPTPYKPTPPPQPLQYIPFELLEHSLTEYKRNTFVKWLYRLFGGYVAQKAVERYLIGTSCSKWEGACVFWFVTKYGRVKAGQVKLFDNNGHTASYTDEATQAKKKCTNWVHWVMASKLKKDGKTAPEWLTKYIGRGEYCTTLYGEHLLSKPENADKPIALVEAPKTAIVGSIYFPQYVWLAVGALAWFTEDRIKILTGKEVYLFPDLGAFDVWDKRGKCYAHIARFTTVDILEKHATPEERANGLDLCDYLIRTDYKEYLLQAFKEAIQSAPDERDVIIAEYWERGLTMDKIKELINSVAA